MINLSRYRAWAFYGIISVIFLYIISTSRLSNPSNFSVLFSDLQEMPRPHSPSPEELREIEKQWVDPVTEAPELTSYKLFETPVRGPNTTSSYLIYLPSGYETSEESYPVIYWLHGGNGYAHQAAPVVPIYHAAMEAGLMPKTIIVMPQGLPIGWYINNFDRSRPVEDVIIQDLLPHVDATYRTKGDAARGIEGFSMGGYGTLHLGFKYPELFKGISSIAPSILPSLDDEPGWRTENTFNGSQELYDANAPWTLARENGDALKSVKQIRLLSGADDTRLTKCIADLKTLLGKLGIILKDREIVGAAHDFVKILQGMGDDAFLFWTNAFA